MRKFVRSFVMGLIFVTTVVKADRLEVKTPLMPATSRIQAKIHDKDPTITDITLNAARPGQEIIAKNRKAFFILNSTDAQNAGLDLNQIKPVLRQQAFGKLNSSNLKDYYIIANFQHGVLGRAPFEAIELFDEGLFWVALVPKNSDVDSVIFQTDWFADGTAAHTQLRFQFANDFIIIPQNIKNGRLQIETQSKLVQRIRGDVVYSLFGLPSAGGSNQWDMKAGLLGELAGVRTLSSIDHIAWMKASRDYIEQFVIDTNRKASTNPAHANENYDAAQDIFKLALSRGQQHGYNQIYHLTFASCITEVFQILRASGLQVNTNIVSPYRVAKHLKANKVILGEPLASLGEEYGLTTQRAISPLAKKNLKLISSVKFDEAIRVITLQMLQDRWGAKDIDYLLSTFKQILANHPNLAQEPLDFASLKAEAGQLPPPTPETKQKIVNVLQKIAELQAPSMQAVLTQFMLENKVGY